MELMGRLSLGTVQFGMDYGIANSAGKVPCEEIGAMLEYARNNNIKMLDTAIAYGDSERRLGISGVDDFNVVTKLPEVPEGCDDIPGLFKKQILGSLSRLGVPKLYGVLLHKPEQLLEKNFSQIYDSLIDLKINGLVDKIGISIYSPTELLALEKNFSFDIVQAPFNLIDRRLESSGWLYQLKNKGVEIHTRSAFLQGLLLMSQDKIPLKFSPWKSLLENWHLWLRNNDVTAVEACLRFPLSFPEIDKVVVGSDNLEQLKMLSNVSNMTRVMGEPVISCDDENLINPGKWSKL